MANRKKFESFELAPGRPLPAALAPLALGPTGNLRAPALRLGDTWLIGFHEEAWSEVLDG